MSDTDELLREVDQLTDEEVRADRDEREGSRADASGRAGGSGPTPDASATAEQGRSRSLRDRLPSPSLPSVPTLLTPRGLLLALVFTVTGFVLGGFVPLVGGVTGLVGVAVAGFVLGLFGRGRYLELALAGAVTGAVAFLLDRLVLSVVGEFAFPLAVVGGTAGLVAAVLGLYFGRDLNDGLTRDV